MNLRQDIDINEYSDIIIRASYNLSFDIFYFTGVCLVKWYISFFLIFEGWHNQSIKCSIFIIVNSDYYYLKYYLVPVDPNPPSPRTVSLNSSASTNSAVI